MRKPLLCVVALVSFCFQAASQTLFDSSSPAKVHMVVWRGCEEACSSFIRYFKDRDLPVEVAVTDVARDRDQLVNVEYQLKSEAPDLVVTWGTSVTRAILGTRADYGAESALGDVPALFMIVADPVGSDIIASYENSGRQLISGVRNRVPEDVQMRLMFEYYRPKKLGVLNDPNELNSKLNTEKLQAISDELQFEVVEELYDVNAEGEIDPAQIPEALAELKKQGAEAIYVGSSSFNLENQDVFVAAATELGLPVFSAYTQMVRDSGALMAVGSNYSNIGRLAAVQAERVLLKGDQPGELPVKSLNRFSVILNIETARALELYPPLSLLGIAEVIR
ncbi:MAG: ABC transporter substrate-binding protein [Pseudomonadota bacterium]